MNKISHESAHDALSDVIATIEMARLIKTKQPRLYQYIYELRFKHKVQQLINLQKQTPLVHISGMYPADKGHLGIVVPIAMDANNKNAVIVYELHNDPSALLKMNIEQIKRLTFSRTEDLAENEQRLPLKTIHLNKCPVIVPLKTLTEENIKQWHIDLNVCANNLERLKTDQTLPDRIQKAFQTEYAPPSHDPDQNLYSGGFFSPADKERMNQIRTASESALSELEFHFDDPRLDEMFFRYRCRNFPDTLLMTEIEQWNQYRFNRMTTPEGDASIKLEEYYQELRDIRNENPSPSLDIEKRNHLLDQLEAYPKIIGLDN